MPVPDLPLALSKGVVDGAAVRGGRGQERPAPAQPSAGDHLACGRLLHEDPAALGKQRQKNQGNECRGNGCAREKQGLSHRSHDTSPELPVSCRAHCLGKRVNRPLRLMENPRR